MTHDSSPEPTSAVDPVTDIDTATSHTGRYLAVLVVMCSLVGVSLWLLSAGGPIESVALRRTVLLGISTAQASLVLLFLMHLWYEAVWKYVMTIPAVILALVLVLVLLPDALHPFAVGVAQ